VAEDCLTCLISGCLLSVKVFPQRVWIGSEILVENIFRAFYTGRFELIENMQKFSELGNRTSTSGCPPPGPHQLFAYRVD